jgi:hypothetical protein
MYDSEILIQNHVPELLNRDFEPDKIDTISTQDFIAVPCNPETILERVVFNDNFYRGTDTITPGPSRDFNVKQAIENISTLQSTLNPYYCTLDTDPFTKNEDSRQSRPK